MLIYEITVTVAADLAPEYEKYMIERHIPDLLATGHFAAAFFARNGGLYRIGYHAESQQHLDAYFLEDAERLRDDFAIHFPTGVTVSRQTLEVLALFPSEE